MSPNKSSDPPTEPEFTAQHPLIVNVGYINNNWDIQPSTTERFPPDEKLYSDKMMERVSALGGRASLKAAAERRVLTGGLVPQSVTDPHHIPIVVRPWEYVRFQSDHPFFILAGREQSVFPDPNSPDSPFVWPASQSSQKSTRRPPYFVIGVAQHELHHQRFYKCVAWVVVDGERRCIDPDTLGTSDTGG